MDDLLKRGTDEAQQNPPLRAQLAANIRLLQQLQALTSAILEISSELDLNTVLQRIADIAREFAGASYTAVGIVNLSGIITSFITSGISQEEREQIGSLPRGHGLLGILIKQGQPLRVRDMSLDPRHSGFPSHHPPMTSLLGLPISLKGRVVGDLYLTDKMGADEFSVEDEWWMTLFTQQAAVAIENANLHKKTRVASQRAQTLAELTSALNRATEPHALFEQITQAACRLLELPAAALYLLNTPRTRFELQAQVGLSQTTPDQSFLPLEASIAAQVLASEQPVAVYDTQSLAKIYFLPMASGVGPRALLVVPILQHEQPVSGVIEVYAHDPRFFSQEEVALLEAFAGQAALALERVRLYQQKEEFLSMTAHDLRAPLTAIKMSAGLLEASLPAASPQPLLQLVANIHRNSERLNNMLEDLLDLTRLEQGQLPLNLDDLELGEVVRATVQTLIPLFESKHQKLQLVQPTEAILVRLDRRRFEQILVNLLTNAHKYTPDSGQMTISFEPTLAAQQVKLGITDNGPGIPPDEQERIFDRYYRRVQHERSGKITGSGLGLPIARRLTELHGGKLEVESAVGQGSTFWLELPLLANAD